MMDRPDLPPVPPALAIAESLRRRRTVACDWNGVPAFAKRTRRVASIERLRRWCWAPLVRRVLTPAARRPLAVRRSRRVPFEVARLAELREAGVAVPQVLAVRADYFVIAAAGRTLESVLDAEPNPVARRAWMISAAEDLARFHRAGHWHGGAQVRNVLVSDRGFTRIDFDRALDAHLPPDLLRVIDVALLLMSLVPYADGDTLRTVARRYEMLADPESVGLLRRVCRVVEPLARSRLLAWLAPKEVGRLAAFLAACRAAPEAGQPGGRTPVTTTNSPGTR